jgi:branched-chain amino acid transport system ATP-binding protein
VLDGLPQKLRQNANVKVFYLGLTELGSRRSYRDVKYDKRRKRWS